MKWLAILLLALLPRAVAATQDAVPGLYAVMDVASDDTLNLRAAPDAGSRILGDLAPDADGIEVIAISADGKWAEIGLPEGTAWAALRYLRPEPGEWQGRFPMPLACSGTEPFWSLNVTDDALRFDRMEGGGLELPPGVRLAAEGRRDRWSVRAGIGDDELTLVIGADRCSDGMSDRAYGLTADLLLSTEGGPTHLSGCCTLAVD